VTEQINLEDIKVKLIDKLQACGWSHLLRGFIQSTDFDKIIETLYKERQDGKRFTPPLKNVFSAFENCPLNDLKVILIGQDPYPYLNVADGMAFSCSITQKPQPSLKYIFHAIEHTIHQDFPTYQEPDLTRWAKQGVLLLNTALTCEIDKVGSHYHIWKDFISYIIDMLNFTNSGLVYILLGAKAQEFEDIISNNHYILKASHPASAAHNGTHIWDCKDIFNETNRLITGNLGSEFKINW
jgi:uracil-DNA glycosylase